MSDGPAPIVVNNTSELYSAMKVVQPGGQILLASGDYGLLTIRGVNPTDTVTFSSLDPTRPAHITGVNVSESSNLAFRSLDVGVDARTGYAVSLVGDRNVTVDGLNIHGVSVGDGNAMLVRRSFDITVTNSEVHDIGTGFAHLDSNGVVFSGNRFHDLQADAIRGGGTSNITVSGNHFTDFFPRAGDHPDAIQFWTTNTTTSASNITVTDNTFVRGAGSIVQGIFLGNEVGNVYENVTITGNAIIGGMYNGIYLNTANNVTIQNNVVQGYQDMTSWIAVTKTTNAIVTDNSATEIKNLAANTALTLTGNTLISAGAIGDVSALQILHPVFVAPTPVEPAAFDPTPLPTDPAYDFHMPHFEVGSSMFAFSFGSGIFAL